MRINLYTNQPNQTQSYSNFKRANIDVKSAIEDTPAHITNKISNTPAITIAALSAVCGAVLLSRGVQKNIHKGLNVFKESLEERTIPSSFQKSSKKAKLQELSIQKINSFLSKSESVNNITSLKDILFMKLMYKTKPTKAIHDSITNQFEKISKNTVLDSYKKTAKNFSQMNKIFDELDEHLLKNTDDKLIEYEGKQHTKKELIEKARDYRESAKLTVESFLNEKTIEQRYNYMKDVTSSLYTNFWDASFKDFWSKNNKFKRKEMWQTFIAAEQIKGNKTELSNWITFARNAITYTKIDQFSNVYEYIKAIDNIMPVADKEGRSIIKRLKWFAKNPDIFQTNKEPFLEELKKLKEHKISISADNQVSKTIEEYKNTNIDFINKQILDNKPGALQDMLSIYYKIAPYELEGSGAIPAVKKAVKSFDKSVNMECVEFFDKIRDLRLGSAPTDVLTLLFSFMALSYGLGHAKDTDKRISVMFKTGIPIVGGIAATMYSTTKLVSGGKSIAFGILSAILLNQLGTIADNTYKNTRVAKIINMNTDQKQ